MGIKYESDKFSRRLVFYGRRKYGVGLIPYPQWVNIRPRVWWKKYLYWGWVSYWAWQARFLWFTFAVVDKKNEV